MKDYATIFIHTRDLPLGFKRYDVEWFGDSDVAEVSDRALLSWGHWYGDWTIGQNVWIGPYRVRVIDRDVLQRTFIVRRGSRFRTFVALAMTRLGYRIREFTDRLYITFYVWGMAPYNDSGIIDWRNVRPVAWLRRTVRGR